MAALQPIRLTLTAADRRENQMAKRKLNHREIADRIVSSDAFKAINLLIDQRADELTMYLHSFRERVEQAFKPQFKEGIPVRVSYEPGGRVSKELPADPSTLLSALDGGLEQIRRLKDQINELQRFKLRLLNDYDFTHGNDADQRAVFADVDR